MAGNATRIGLLGVLAGMVAGFPGGGAVGTAAADPSVKPPSVGDTIPTPPPTYQANNVNVVEHLGAKLPLDARFKTHEGKSVSLGEVLTGDLPTILTFNYADCPMLCSQQLNGLTAAMPETAKPHPVPGADKELALVLGEHYRIVTISLEPDESPDRLAKMRGKYLERVGARADSADAKWTFLTGDASSVERVAEVVGFGYTYIPDRAEWAHPAAFIFVSSAGAITRYVYGIEFPRGVLGESIYKAGLAEASTAAGFMFRCYHYDPAAKDHSRVGVLALRIGAASCVALLAAFGIMQVIRRKPRREVS